MMKEENVKEKITKNNYLRISDNSENNERYPDG